MLLLPCLAVICHMARVFALSAAQGYASSGILSMSMLSAGCAAVTCLAIFQPVCSTDGIIYPNECLADCSGAEVAYEGECEGTIENMKRSTAPTLHHQCMAICAAASIYAQEGTHW